MAYRYDNFLETAIANFEAAKATLGHSSPALEQMCNGLSLLARGILQEREIRDAELKEITELLRQRR